MPFADSQRRMTNKALSWSWAHSPTLGKPPRRTCIRRRRSKFYKNTAALPKTITLPEGRNASGYWGRSVRSLQAKKINTQSAPRRARQRGDRCVATGLEEPMEWSKTKRATSLRGAGWKQRSFPFKRKGRRGDVPSSGTRPLRAGDDAASQGRQDNDFETPQVTETAVLFPFPD
jgi:hypothetical protein